MVNFLDFFSYYYLVYETRDFLRPLFLLFDSLFYVEGCSAKVVPASVILALTLPPSRSPTTPSTHRHTPVPIRLVGRKMPKGHIISLMTARCQIPTPQHCHITLPHSPSNAPSSYSSLFPPSLLPILPSSSFVFLLSSFHFNLSLSLPVSFFTDFFFKFPHKVLPHFIFFSLSSSPLQSSSPLFPSSEYSFIIPASSVSSGVYWRRCSKGRDGSLRLSPQQGALEANKRSDAALATVTLWVCSVSSASHDSQSSFL